MSSAKSDADKARELFAAERLEESAAFYLRAIKSCPSDASLHNNLGVVFKRLGKRDLALRYFREAYLLNPALSASLYNIGNIYVELGDPVKSIHFYNESLRMSPHEPSYHCGLARALLTLGDYKQGLEEYEWRLESGGASVILVAMPMGPRFTGPITADVSRLLVVAEQGLGDTLQFMRYLSLLVAIGIDVSFCPHPKLTLITSTSIEDVNILTPEQANRDTETPWIPLISLIRLLGISRENTVVNSKYLKVPSALVEKWKKIFSADERPVVAINWNCSAYHKVPNHLGRSIPLKEFEPIISTPRYRYLSVQHGHGVDQFKDCGFRDRFVDFQDQVSSVSAFLETAAIIENCSLVITCDTAMAHLAGGLGKATWLLLMHAPEWRWGTAGDKTGWYESATLFRQSFAGDWKHVIARVVQCLQA